MKLICLQENLKNGLNIIQNIIGKNLILPILNNILLETKNGRLKISSTNLEIGIDTWITCKVEKEGKITIPAKPFSFFINNLPNDKIELELKKDLLLLKCNNYKASFKSLTADEFPIIPKVENDFFCSIPSNIFRKSLMQVVNIASLSESRPEISGILFKFEKNNLKLVATDSFRLVEKNIYNLNYNNETNESIIVPQKTIQELIKISSFKDEEIKFKMDKNQIIFDFSHTQLVSRLIDGQYPNYEKIIPNDFNLQVVLDREEFLNIIKTSSIFSGKNNSVKIIIYPKKSIIEFLSEDPNLGNNICEINVEITSKEEKTEKIEIDFNYKYLIDGLSNLEDKKVIFGINNENSPMIIKGIENNSYLYLIMPIKL